MQPDPTPTCDRCPKPSAGVCCSSHGKDLCHEDYRLTHFVEVCGCRQCEAEGLPKILPRSQPKPVTTPDPSPRWTPETERLMIRVGYGRDVRAYLTALADAGLLLPPGGETRTTWRVQWFCEDRPEGRIDFDDEVEARAYFADDEVTSRVVEGVWRAELQRRSVTSWPDGSVYQGPWEVTDGE